MKFMDEGWGEQRLAVMHNDFVLIGPVEDKARKSARTASDAFKMIADARSTFISRGDESGTHQKEKSLWQEAGVNPDGAWYTKAGSGMAAWPR